MALNPRDVALNRIITVEGEAWLTDPEFAMVVAKLLDTLVSTGATQKIRRQDLAQYLMERELT